MQPQFILEGDQDFEVGDGWTRLTKKDTVNGTCYFGTILCQQGIVVVATERNPKFPHHEYTVLETAWQGRLYRRKFRQFFPPRDLTRRAKRFAKDIAKQAK